MLLFPFIYAIIGNILIHVGWISDLEQIKEYIGIFGPYNVYLMVVIIVFLKHYFGISISEIIEKVTTNVDLSIKRGESEVQIHMPIGTEKDISQIAKESKEIAREEILEEKKVENIKCDECELTNVLEERESLRYFSAYQVTNQFSRELLKKIIDNDKIELDIFVQNLEEYYKKTIRNMGKRRKEDFIEKKINEILYDLRYLDIIEYTEDDKYIILTKNGIEFVKGYMEGVG